MELLSPLNESPLSCSRLAFNTCSLDEVPYDNRKSVSMKDIIFWQQELMLAGLTASTAGGTAAPHAEKI